MTIKDLAKKTGYGVATVSRVLNGQPSVSGVTSLMMRRQMGLYNNLIGEILCGATGIAFGVFVASGFLRTIPRELQEAAMIDGCTPLRTFFSIVMPMLKPTLVSVGILEAMWVWNDYLLPTLVLDIKKYKTIPMLIQYFKGSYGRVEMGPMMACIILTVLPIIIVYLFCQKHIIKGVVAGAVKG